MFVVVDMSERKKRIFEKFRSHQIELKRYDVKGCAPFFVAHCDSNYTDFNELKKIISRYGVALVPDNACFKNELLPLVFNPCSLPLKMLVKTVGEFLNQRGGYCDMAVTVVDPTAVACEVLYILARVVRYVRVVTSRLDRYQNWADKIFSDYGISIEFSENISSAHKSDVLIAVDDRCLDSVECGLVICHKKTTDNKNVIALCESDLSYHRFDCEQYGIDNFTFFCALYETCGYYLPKIPVFKDTGELNNLL